MKNAVPKNDKKRRKQLTEDIAKLETELNQKHENELKQLTFTASVDEITLFLFSSVTKVCSAVMVSLILSKVEEVSNALDSVDLTNNEEKTDAKQARTSKAQKRRVS